MFVLFFITYGYFILLYLLNILSPSQNKTKQKSSEMEFSVERTREAVYMIYKPAIWIKGEDPEVGKMGMKREVRDKTEQELMGEEPY